MKPSHSPPAAPHSFTLIELLVIVATLVVFFCFLIPSVLRGKSTKPCQNNLRRIGVAFHIWALDFSNSLPMQVPLERGGTRQLLVSGPPYSNFRVMSNELLTPKILVCPTDKARKAAK